MTSAREASESAAPGAGPDDLLPLPSRSIRGLRGIEELSIPRLGRVTLLAGRNGVGKTTVLDAVRIYASSSRASVTPTECSPTSSAARAVEWRRVQVSSNSGRRTLWCGSTEEDRTPW